MDITINYGNQSQVLTNPNEVITFSGKDGKDGEEVDLSILNNYVLKEDNNLELGAIRAEINLLTDKIDLKVSQSEFNLVTGQLDTKYSLIAQDSESIKTIVQGLPKKEYVDDKFNLISLGGRNYIPNSSQIDINSTTNAYNYKQLYVPLKKLENYIFTIESTQILDGNITNYNVAIHNFVTNTSVFSKEFIAGNIKQEFKFTTPNIEGLALLVYTGLLGSTNNRGIRLKNVKLEIGNIATDWSAAPEDFTAVFNTYNTRLTQYENELSLKATRLTTDSLGTRLGTAEGLISVQATQIQNKVNVSTYNSLNTKVLELESVQTIQADLIESKVSSTNFTGQTLVSLINQTPSTIKIQAKNIELVGLLTASNLRTAESGRRITINENNDNAIKIRYDNSVIGLEAVVTPEDEVKLLFRNKQGEIIWEAGKSGFVYFREVPESWSQRFHRLVGILVDDSGFYDIDGNLYFNGEQLRNLAQTTTTNGLATRGQRITITGPDGQLYEHRQYLLNTGQFATDYEYNAGQNLNSAVNVEYNGIHLDQEKASPFVQNGWYLTNGSDYTWVPQGGYILQYELVAIKDGKQLGTVQGQISNLTLANN